MNFLEGVQRLRQECGIPGTGPATVTNQSGEMQRLINWYQQALIEIQIQREDWQFLRKAIEFDTVAQQQSYDVETDIGLTDFADWRNDSFRIFLKSGTQSDETFLTQYEYDAFRDFYLYNTQPTSFSRPVAISIAPDKALVLGLPPDDIYTVRGEYYKEPVELVNNADIPVIPKRFHMLIVYSAMKHYGAFEAATEVYQRGTELFNLYYNKLLSDQAPSIGVGSSMI